MSANFHENLKTARKISKLTQKQVAEAVGIARSTYALYETGEREPSVECVKKLAKVLNVSGNFLIGLEDIPEGMHVFYELSNRYGIERITEYLHALERVKK